MPCRWFHRSLRYLHTDKKENHLSDKLHMGSVFPAMTIPLVGGGTMELPNGLDAKYRVVLFYRGHW